MGWKRAAKRIIELSGYTVHRIRPEREVAPECPVPPESDRMSEGKAAPQVYDQDGLRSIHNHDFMNDPDFSRAYARGVAACQVDYQWHWRVHVGLWAAHSASKLKGDFVECGVNMGFLSSAIMEYLGWDSLDRTFFLMDTFCGIDERYVSEEERASGVLEINRNCFYIRSAETVRKNFSQWRNVRIVEGPIPETLKEVETDRVAYLHIDMNNALPEVAAFNYFWERLAPGAFVLFDDYGYKGAELQKAALDAAVAAKDLKVVSLPTGQGLVIKPCSG